MGKVAAECNDHQFNYLIESDGQWDFYYEVLYPSVIEMQLMKNRRVVERMTKAGEDMINAREVCH